MGWPVVPAVNIRIDVSLSSMSVKTSSGSDSAIIDSYSSIPSTGPSTDTTCFSPGISSLNEFTSFTYLPPIKITDDSEKFTMYASSSDFALKFSGTYVAPSLAVAK